MTAAPPLAEGWVNTWIDAQRVALDEWSKGQGSSSPATEFPSFAELFSGAAGQMPGSEGALGRFGGQLAALWQQLGARPQEVRGGGPPQWPDIGPLREQQAALKELGEALADQQRLGLEMAGVLAQVHADTLDLLARRTLEQANAGQPVDSFKALHDLWVECGEVTYAKVAYSDSYCRLQAELCNAGIRVQVQRQQQMERWLRLADLPTRSELNTLNRRLQELKRRVDAAQATGAAPAAHAAKPRAVRKSRRQGKSDSKS